MSTVLFIEPHDILFLRGNKLFGDPGSYGESLVPPPPSVVAGAVRSALMVRKSIDFDAFAANRLNDSEFGNADHPGTFRIMACHLARRRKGDGKVEAIYAMPADLSVSKAGEDELNVRCLQPCQATAWLKTSNATEYLAVLPEPDRGKPETSLWLNADGWRAHLSGDKVDPARHLLNSACLWQMELRTGIGLDPAKRSAATGDLYTAQAVSLHKSEQGGDYHTGFLACTEGAHLPDTMTLRLGGDGRAAQVSLVQGVEFPEPDWERLCEDQRCRIILTSPGIFDGGWRPTGTNGDGRVLRFELGGVKARLVCAAVPRAEVISGWDLAAKRPKPAQRVAPMGSVYWLEELEATPEQLRNLANQGLWPDGSDNTHRRVEGYNRFVFATHHSTSF